MKHMIRKPMLPLILLTLMVFSTVFLACFRADIAEGWAQVDRLYNETQVTIELVPEGGWDEIQMKTHKDLMISGMPEVSETMTLQECYYVLRDGTPLPQPEPEPDVDPEYASQTVPAVTHTIRGTNNLPWLAEYWDLTIDWMDGMDTEDFHVTGDAAPCLVRQELLEETGLKPGDTIRVSPSAYLQEVHYLAPEIPLTIIGTYAESMGRTGGMDLLVPEESFLNGPKLLYYGDLMYRCYYRAYALKLDPSYNREYDRVEDELENILYDLSAYSFATNARAIENAARPLIQKLQMQELLVLPLSGLLLAAMVVAAVLLGLSLDTEVFLRLMWGEKRTTVFFRLSSIVGVWLVLCMAAACAGACLAAGRGSLHWSTGFSTAALLCSMAGCILPLCRACSSNLIKSYQMREGE